MSLSDNLRSRYVAALAVLQPGIAPVFLVLLTDATGISWEYHGWIAAADQLGMAMGALAQWRFGTRIVREHAIMAAVVAALIALVVVDASSVAQVLAARVAYGSCVGLIFNRAESHTVRFEPNRAFGSIFLIQLVLSTVVTMALPVLAQRIGNAAAVRLLAIGPLLIAMLLLGETARRQGVAVAGHYRSGPDDAAVGSHAKWLVIAVMLLFISATMMLWSYAGALGASLGLASDEIGVAIAIGSGAGAVTAAAATLGEGRFLLGTGLLCAMAMAMPFLAQPWAAGGMNAHAGFVFAMCMFNIGSTFAIIRFSAQAVLLDPSGGGRRRITALRCVAMVVGPTLGGVAVRIGGQAALAETISAALVLAVAILFVVRRQGTADRRRGPAARNPATRPRPHAFRRNDNHMEKPSRAMYGVREEAGNGGRRTIE